MNKTNEKVKIAVIGCGGRGRSCLRLMQVLGAYEVVAVCDPYEDKAELAAEEIVKNGGNRPLVYTDHIKLYDEVKPEAAYVATTWETHVHVSIDALKRGIAVAMEVGGAYNLEECFELVKAYEETKTPFMFMENCCYNKDELLATSLFRNGKFGEVVHCHGAYRHDLREEVSSGKSKRHYRLRNYLNRNCENYPTHELGPIAKILNINRGNRMVSLVSMASKARGLHEFVQGKEEYEFLKDAEFKQGDVVETLISCENGETISLKLDTTLPNFYSREFTVRGTKGLYNQDGNFVFLDGDEIPGADCAVGTEKFLNNAEKYKEYLPEVWQDPDWAIELGHGGMDAFLFQAFAEHLKKGEEMPIDVYDAVAWMSITCLSEISIKEKRIVDIPDFTNGAYKNRPTKDVVEIPKIQ